MFRASSVSFPACGFERVCKRVKPQIPFGCISNETVALEKTFRGRGLHSPGVEGGGRFDNAKTDDGLT